jgi:hypothetical protein
LVARPFTSGDADLEEAAVIFLRGPMRSGGMDIATGEIPDQAVTQVARKLSSCSPAAIQEIKQALVFFRHEPSLRARDAVIESVTHAAAHLPIATKENR